MQIQERWSQAKITSSLKKLLTNRQSCDIISGFPTDKVCILSTRHVCDVINEPMLNRIDSTEIQLKAQDSID